MTKSLKLSALNSYSNLDSDQYRSLSGSSDVNKKRIKSSYKCPAWWKREKYHKSGSASHNEIIKGTKDEISPIIESFNDETDSSRLDFCSVHSKEVADEHRSFLIYYYGINNGEIEEIPSPLNSFVDFTNEKQKIKYSRQKVSGKSRKVAAIQKKSVLHGFSTSTSGWVDFNDSASVDTFTTCSVTDSSLEFSDFYPLVSPDSSPYNSLGKSCEKELFPEESIVCPDGIPLMDCDDSVSESCSSKSSGKTHFENDDAFNSIFRLNKSKVDENDNSISSPCRRNDSGDLSMIPMKRGMNEVRNNVEERLILFASMAGQTIEIDDSERNSLVEAQNGNQPFDDDNEIGSLSSKCNDDGKHIISTEGAVELKECSQENLIQQRRCTPLKTERQTENNSIVSLKPKQKNPIESNEDKTKIKLERNNGSLDELNQKRCPNYIHDKHRGTSRHMSKAQSEKPTSMFDSTEHDVEINHDIGIPPLYPRTIRKDESSTVASHSLGEYDENSEEIEDIYLNGSFEDFDDDTYTSHDSPTSVSSFQKNYEYILEDDGNDSFYSSDGEDEDYSSSYCYYTLSEEDMNNNFDYDNEMSHESPNINDFVQFSLDDNGVISGMQKDNVESSLSSKDSSDNGINEDMSECSSLYFRLNDKDCKPKSVLASPEPQMPRVSSLGSFVYSIDGSDSLCGLSFVDDLSVKQASKNLKQPLVGYNSNTQPNGSLIEMTYSGETTEKSCEAERSIFAKDSISSNKMVEKSLFGDKSCFTPAEKYQDEMCDDSVDLITRRKYLTEFLESSIKGDLFIGAMEGDSQLKEEVTELISKFRRESERQKERMRNVREGFTNRKLAGI